MSYPSVARLLARGRAELRRLIDPVYGPALFGLAAFYRARLHRVVFVGVTGSCGKTTAKDLIAAVLATRFRGRKTLDSLNAPLSTAKAIFHVRPWDEFYVSEISGAHDGKPVIDESLPLVRPQIGVVTNIGTDHLSAFHSIDAVAAEKGKLIAALPPDGLAVLNADDERVRAMQTLCAGRVVTYGLAPDAMVRAESISACWPDRLSFTVCYEGQSYRVQTQLCGTHLVTCVLAALAVGIATGIPIADAIRAIGAVPPPGGRMYPVSRPDGVVFIQDDRKAPLWSIPAALHFMKDARAARKVVVIGTISDYSAKSQRAYVSVARQALDVADCVVFVGPRASKCLKARRHPKDEALQAFYSMEAACEYLGNWLRRGDLVLVKGSRRDEMWKIIEGSVRSRNGAAAGPTARHSTESANPAQAVVGLGNPGERYQNTPHNIGQRAVDILAASLAAEWTREDQAMVARVARSGQSVYLIKPLTKINTTGPVLLRLSHRLGFEAAGCTLVHDDLDLPLGAVRVRMRGSDGGHRGVRSVLEVFQTDAFRRVKIGVGRPGEKGEAAVHVLEAFPPAELPLIDKTCAEAADRILKLLEAAAASPRVECDSY
jgi:aminoacyl-tRNA hydrolase